MKSYIYIVINLDSYQLSNRKFKFWFYILVDNGFNDLPQICIFLKVIYMYKYLGMWWSFGSVKKDL